MAGSKHFDKIAWIFTILIFAVTVLFTGHGAALGIEAMSHTMGYEKRLFDNTQVHTIDIVMNNWDEFISNAVSEEYYLANVVIDGEAYKNVAIRGKGNTSLSSVASMNSDRYSFKIEFDYYDSSLTYYGLDKLNLNNMIHDTTMMKDYLTYTLMNEFDVHAPLCSFVYITVNGEDWGLYLAVEGVEEAFLKRNFGSDYGELYKPDSMDFGGGRGFGKDFDMNLFMNRNEPSDNTDMFGQGIKMPQMPNFPNMQGGIVPDAENMQIEKGGFGRGMSSSDVKLQYIDDNIDSYPNIWNNAKTNINKTDQMRLIKSLQKLTNGEEIDSVVNIEQVIRFFVVHNYVCNGDSYTGNMVHNYYLYEKNGQMTMIPWDYNLAFGTFQGGNAQSIVNTPIDSPVSGASSDDRPMWNWIVANTEYTELYHQYFTEFLNSVDIIGAIDNAYALIKSYVEKDPTSFFGHSEFETGVETLREFCALRTESISAQLANNTTSESMNYADASGLTLSKMGSMGMGVDLPDMPEKRGNFLDGVIPEGFDPPQPGELPKMPDGFNPSQMFGGNAEPGPGQFLPGQVEKNNPTEEANSIEQDNLTENKTENDMIRTFRNNSQMPGGDLNFSMDNMGPAKGGISGWLWIIISVLVLCAGLVIVKKYK